MSNEYIPTDYTPTTEDVRYAHIWWRDQCQHRVSNWGEEFDRWLAQHDADVAKQTEERIIALLKAHAGAECGFGVEHDLVALIKGEN